MLRSASIGAREQWTNLSDIFRKELMLLLALYGRDSVSIPGSGRSPEERNGYPLQYSCLENPMDRGAWQAIVHGVAKNRI